MALSYDYYPAVLYAIDLIGQGQTKTAACDASNISVATLARYTTEHPDLADLLLEAETRGADAMADALVNIDNHKIHGHSDPKMAKVVSDNIKWVLSKRDKRFADRVEVDHNHRVDVTITTALEAARRRVPALEDQSNVIDAVVLDDEALLLQELLS